MHSCSYNANIFALIMKSMEDYISVHVKFPYAYLKLLIEFIFYPVGHMSKSNLSFTQFRPSFQFQMRSTSETIPEINKHPHMSSIWTLYLRNMFYFWVLKMYIFCRVPNCQKNYKNDFMCFNHAIKFLKCILKSNLSCTEAWNILTCTE